MSDSTAATPGLNKADLKEFGKIKKARKQEQAEKFGAGLAATALAVCTEFGPRLAGAEADSAIVKYRLGHSHQLGERNLRLWGTALQASGCGSSRQGSRLHGEPVRPRR